MCWFQKNKVRNPKNSFVFVSVNLWSPMNKVVFIGSTSNNKYSSKCGGHRITLVISNCCRRGHYLCPKSLLWEALLLRIFFLFFYQIHYNHWIRITRKLRTTLYRKFFSTISASTNVVHFFLRSRNNLDVLECYLAIFLLSYVLPSTSLISLVVTRYK